MPVRLPDGFTPGVLHVGGAAAQWRKGDVAMAEGGELMVVTEVGKEVINVERVGRQVTGKPDYGSLPNHINGMYRNRNGMPMSLREWTRAFEESDRQIARDEFKGILVSTVWTGMHNGHPNATQARGIFETAVFEKGNASLERRWDTEAEARFKHGRIVQLLNTAGWGTGMLATVF